MTYKAPGKAYRRGITLTQLFRMFPDDATVRAWFEKQRWGNEEWCSHCGSLNVRRDHAHLTVSHRCREKECRKHFSVRTNSVMASSKLGYQTWAIAIYLLTTSLKRVSSMKLHRDLGITQKSAWHLAHRLRKSWENDDRCIRPPMRGPVEVDESYFGGKRKNMSNAKRAELKDTGRGPIGKTAVVGMRDRNSNEVRAEVTPDTKQQTLQGFVHSNAPDGTKVYTDESSSYDGVENRESVRHSTSEYVRGQAHVNGVESFWALLKRGYQGTYHHMSPEHLNRYVNEFAGRHNIRELDTIEQMAWVVRGMLFKRPRYSELIAH